MITTALSLFSLVSFGAVDAHNCLPKSSLRFPLSNKKSMEGPMEMTVQRQIDHFLMIMKPLVKKETGKILKVKLDWGNPRVNASATRDNDDNPVIIIMGGMVRHPQLTPDGLYGILCHELGHHLGGSPKKRRGRSTKLSWSSAEGQADYYTTTNCLPHIFERPLKTINPDYFSDSKEVGYAIDMCADKKHCVRMTLAGLSMSRVFASLKDYYELPSLDIEDQNEAWETELGHPHPQCRLDTFKAGAVSLKRPVCWYKPEW